MRQTLENFEKKKKLKTRRIILDYNSRVLWDLYLQVIHELLPSHGCSYSHVGELRQHGISTDFCELWKRNGGILSMGSSWARWKEENHHGLFQKRQQLSVCARALRFSPASPNTAYFPATFLSSVSLELPSVVKRTIFVSVQFRTQLAIASNCTELFLCMEYVIGGLTDQSLAFLSLRWCGNCYTHSGPQTVPFSVFFTLNCSWMSKKRFGPLTHLIVSATYPFSVVGCVRSILSLPFYLGFRFIFLHYCSTSLIVFLHCFDRLTKISKECYFLRWAMTWSAVIRGQWRRIKIWKWNCSQLQEIPGSLAR